MSGEELAEICNEIASGKSLRAICRDKGLPESTVRYRLHTDPDAFAQTVRARELGCDALADECLEIADGKDTSEAKRIRIDTRLKLIGKWSQRYGDKVQIDSRSEVIHRYDLDSLSDGEIIELERILANADPSEGRESKALPAGVH